jgi:hypothetical protein
MNTAIYMVQFTIAGFFYAVLPVSERMILFNGVLSFEWHSLKLLTVIKLAVILTKIHFFVPKEKIRVYYY